MLNGISGMVDTVLPIAEWVLKIAGGLSLVALAFIGYTIFSGKTAILAKGSSQWSNINLANGMVPFLVILAALGAIFVIWEQKGSGLAITALGAGLFIGLPMLLASQHSDAKMLATVAGYTANGFTKSCHTAGMGVAVIGMLRLLIELIVWLVEMPDRMMQKGSVGQGMVTDAAQRKVARDANALSPCWSLPFCREVIRKQCPAYLARKTCWKFKRGCYCDDEMIARIIRGDSLEKIKMPTTMSKSRKPPCKRCYIFLEHQGHKFRMLSPLALPLTIVIMVSAWGPLDTYFPPAYRIMDSWQKKLNIFSAPNPIEAKAEDIKTVQDMGKASEEQSIMFMQWFIGLIMGFFTLIYTSKFIEWIVFERKL